jgi:NAD(P)-dependent dehydrogenase (short-subunit alcohol dehydrogenase family)
VVALEQKVIVVAGGATGIGAESARQLAQAGARVVVGDINEDSGRRTVEAMGPEARFIPFDISDEESVKALIGGAIAAFGRLDGLFSNAADLRPEVLSMDTDIVSMESEIWHRSLAVDLTGFFYTARHAVPHLLAAGGGSIVVTSSAAAFQGGGTRPAYATSKAGLGALVRHIATRWGKEGVRCNAVAPGLVLSDELRPNVPAVRQEAYLRSQLLGRLGEPKDIASMVTYLFSDEAEWITGQVFGVDGGMVLR